MFSHNPSGNYQPNGGRYLQILSGKVFYNQMVVVSSDGTFHARFPNILVDYLLGEMQIGNKSWTHWNKAPLRLWQTQMNFAMWCASSACRVSSQHLNYVKHPMVRLLYRFHGYYDLRKILKDYRFHCHMKLVLILLIILIPMKIFLKFVRIMKFLTIPWNIGTKSFIGLTSEV